MPRQIKSPDDLYEKHRLMIYRLIHRYERDGYADFGDLESLSNEVFARCLRRWRPGRGAFSTLLYTALSNAFRSELKKGENRLRGDAEWLYLSRDVETTDGREWLSDFMKGIDGDARRIVAKLLRMSVEPDSELASPGKAESAVIERILADQRERITKAFSDVRTALGV
jgi:DNA-directed RNA polymerase specialized sigma24 family protein